MYMSILNIDVSQDRMDSLCPGCLDNFKGGYQSRKKARQSLISLRQNWDNFLEINAIGKCLVLPPWGSCTVQVDCGGDVTQPTVDKELYSTYKNMVVLETMPGFEVLYSSVLH